MSWCHVSSIGPTELSVLLLPIQYYLYT